MAYEMQGLFIEACDCRTLCPCWLDEEADDDECTGLIAWYVESGTINDLDVSGRTVVGVSHHQGHRKSGGQEIVLLIDDKATDQQSQALQTVFTGRDGGPLAELSKLASGDPIYRSAPITYTHDGAATVLRVGKDGETVSVDATPLVGALGRVTTVVDSALALLLGTPAEVGKSSRMKIAVNRAPLDTDVTARSATRGRFAYRNRPGS